MNSGTIKIISRAWLTVVLLATNTVAAVPAPKPFVFALRGKPFRSLSSLDAFTANQITVEAEIMEGLLRFDPTRPDQQPQLNLAWQQFMIDSRTYVFRLRKDIYFHPFPGHPKDRLTAQDVTFSLQRAKNSKSPLAGELADVTSIDAVGDDLVKIKLARPNRSLPAILATSIGHITSKQYFLSLGKDEAKFNRHPIGTGPYLLPGDLTNADTIVLQRFKAYHDPYWVRSPDALESVTFRFYEDPKMILKGIQDGQVSMARLPLTEYGDGFNFKLSTGTVTILTPPFLTILAINVTRAPLDDDRIRRLLNAAVQKTKVLGICHSDPSTLPPGFQYYMAIPQQNAKATDAGTLQRLLGDPSIQPALAQMRKTGLTILAPRRLDHVADQILETVIADLQNNLGIIAHIARADTVSRNAPEARHADLLYAEWTPDTPWEQEEPSILRPLFESDSGYNLGNYRDAKVDDLFSQISGIVDPGTIDKIYGDIQKRLIEKAPLIWLPSVRHMTIFLRGGYEAPYFAPGIPTSTLVHFTSMLKDIRIRQR